MGAGVLDGGVAFITGAASGIGKATAYSFAKYGASSLALADINVAGLKDITGEIKSQYPNIDIGTFEVDTGDEQSIISAHEAVVKQFGRIDYAVNNAGIAGSMKASTDMSLAEFKKSIDINMIGVWLCQREQLKQFLKQDPHNSVRGTIVNLSSIYGKQVGSNTTSYGTGKHGVIGLTRNDARNFAKDGIRINAVCPGYTATPMIKLPQAGVSVGMQQYLDNCPMGRLGEPDEIADVIVFLSSPMSRYVNGVDLSVDGGFGCV
ncbi:hypothetical protein B0A52_06777 [Exophiala mesophila]|uniref:Uncharacterized protein n=1 Tax=Exophiala mesophila TaxID=212818 RepID=A0A438N034_EXOME|nr:hypothetical protein B0A52_06777 [Exophiala mesophila]